MEKKTAMEILKDGLQMDVQLGFLKQKDVDRIVWYINTYHLPKEREQIEEACIDMLNRGDDISPDTVRQIISDYFTQTYGKG